MEHSKKPTRKDFMKPSQVLSFPFLLPFVMGGFIVSGIYYGGWGYWSGFLFISVIHPVLDLLGGQTFEARDLEKYHYGTVQTMLLLSVPLQVIYIVTTFIIINTRSLSYFEWMGVSLSLSFTTAGLGMTAGHELIHRKFWWEKRLGDFLYLTVGYPHFPIEHVHGHHKNVATPLDSATAKKNETLYGFWVRSVLGGFKSAWNHERWQMQFVLSYMSFILICLSIVLVWNFHVLLFYMVHCVGAILMLEAVNYLQHYGLKRKKLGPHEYEPVQYYHSWESPQNMTNWFLFNLGRHAEHHRYPTKPFYQLQPKPLNNIMPVGYSLMFLMTFVPPFWRSVMNPRITS
ncbi:MAG TPA: alkane 1-monooxygenase [Bdellovibrionota bacterium]|nr:alkane 1-monooxygenase [Bdellovibrionota bacterium]